MRVDENTIKSILRRRRIVEGLASLEAPVARAVRDAPAGRLDCGPYTVTLDPSGYLFIVEKPRGTRYSDDPDQLRMAL